MLAAIPILIFLVVPVMMLGIRLLRLRFSYYWLIAAAVALTAWPMMLLARLRLPFEIPLGTWQPTSLFPLSPVLLLDYLSWPYAAALATLALAVILTDVARASVADWSAWAGGLVLAGLGLVAVLAGNPLTLLLSWAAIDLFEFIVLMGQISQAKDRNLIVSAFSARVAGLVLVMWSSTISRSTGMTLTFMSIHPDASIYLLLGAGLRLGVVPLHLTALGQRPQRRGLGTLLRLVPVSSSLMLLARTANSGATPSITPLLLWLAGISALYGAVSWLRAPDELEGRPSWILGMASFVLASATLSKTEACLAWGIALLIPGGMLFITSLRHQRLTPLLLFGAIGLLGLPFTPSWDINQFYGSGLGLPTLLFMPAHALLLAGYLRHALRQDVRPPGLERWVWLIYPWGLALLPVAYILIEIWSRPEGSRNAQNMPSLLASWPAAAVLGLVGILLLLHRLVRARPSPRILRTLATLNTWLSFGWFYRLAWEVYRALGRGVAFINLILEGEGGVLWTLLLLTLLMAALWQRGLGG